MTLSSSDGWPEMGPMRSVRRAPPVTSPKTNTSSSRTDPSRGPRVLVAAQPAIAANEDRGRGQQRRSRTGSRRAGAGPGPARGRRRAASTRSCGRRCIISSEMPAEHAPRSGKRISSMRRPVMTNSDVDDEERDQVGGQQRRIGQLEMARRGTTRRLTQPTIRAMATTTSRPQLAPAQARPDARRG